MYLPQALAIGDTGGRSMKIGIIVFSATGHTASVAERIAGALAKERHATTIERIEVSGDPMGHPEACVLTREPSLGGYDALVFGTSVIAFCANPIMMKYLDRAEGIGGKSVWAFVTHGLPFAWMGGNNATRQIVDRAAKKGGKTIGCATVSWGNKRREEQAEAAIANAVRAFATVTK